MVQDEVAAKVTAAISQGLDVRRRAAGGRPLAGLLDEATRRLAARVTAEFVRSPEFERLWVTLNRTAHRQLVAILTGRPAAGGTVRADPDGRLWLDLGPVIEQVLRKLPGMGPAAAGTPPVRLELGRVAAAGRARAAARWLDRTAAWLPWAAAICLLVSVALSRDRRRTVLALGLGTVVTMLTLRAGLSAVRHAGLAAIPPEALGPAVAGHVFDRVTAGLRDTLRVLTLLGVLVAVAALTWAHLKRISWRR